MAISTIPPPTAFVRNPTFSEKNLIRDEIRLANEIQNAQRRLLQTETSTSRRTSRTDRSVSNEIKILSETASAEARLALDESRLRSLLAVLK